jgi:hypothetical protein
MLHPLKQSSGWKEIHAAAECSLVYGESNAVVLGDVQPVCVGKGFPKYLDFFDPDCY